MTEKLNIYQKLVKVRASIGFQAKEKAGYGYNYVSESQILLAMSEQMNTQNLFLEQEMLSLEEVTVSVKTKTQGYVNMAGLRAHFQYIITDADDPKVQITRKQIVQNSGNDAQTLGGLMTYGMKYFLFKFFNIAMDKEDPDAKKEEVEEKAQKHHEQKSSASKNNAKPIVHQQPASNVPLASFNQLQEIYAITANNVPYQNKILSSLYENHGVSVLTNAPQNVMQEIIEKAKRDLG